MPGLGAVVVGAPCLSIKGADEVVLGAEPASAASSVPLESVRSADAKAGGNSRPRALARRKIPAAALGLKKNLSGTSSNSTSANDEDASPPLGHSEVTAVQHSPGEIVKPDVPQRADHDREISATGGTEQAGDVQNEDPSARSNKLIGNPCELEEKAGALAGESSPPAGSADVLARESACEQINAGVRTCEWNSWPFSVGATAVSVHLSGSPPPVPRCDFSNVVEARHVVGQCRASTGSAERIEPRTGR